VAQGAQNAELRYANLRGTYSYRFALKTEYSSCGKYIKVLKH